MNILIWLLTAVHVIVALFLIVLVLMQKSNEQGVGAAFGGGVTENVFGAGTTSALVRMTIWCACIMLGSTLLLAILHSHNHAERPSVTSEALRVPAQAPAAATVPQLPGGNVPNIAPTPAAPAPATTPAPEAESKPAAPAPAPDANQK